MAGEAMTRAVVVLALAALEAPTTAQQRGPDVVVTARKPPSVEVIRKRVRAITRQTDEQVARFTDPVCATTIGLPDPYAGKVSTRIMNDAKAAGIDTAGTGCRPNITVVIVDDSKGLLTELKRRKPAIFNAMPASEVERAIAEQGPARVVTVTQLLSRDGRAPSGDQSSGNTQGMLNGAPVLVVDSASIINLATRQDITGSLVLIDTGATMGKTLNQLADYAAMRTLAKTNARMTGDDDTILSLFSGSGTPPRALTPFDMAFLKALYHGPPTLAYGKKIADMTREIAALRD